MYTIPIEEVMKQLPIAEIEESLTHFLHPIMEQLPDKRLSRVVPLTVQGILGSESPIILQRGSQSPAAKVKRGPWLNGCTV